MLYWKKRNAVIRDFRQREDPEFKGPELRNFIALMKINGVLSLKNLPGGGWDSMKEWSGESNDA